MLQNYLYLKPTSCYNMTDTNQRDTEKIMQLRYEIPDTFWSLFRSVNREIYMESLLVINEEYQYSNYFLTKEICVQVLSDMNAQKQVLLQREENETDFDMLETTASRILRWLLKTGWLKKIEDYSTMTTNIVIPDYVAVFIEAFEHLHFCIQVPWKRRDMYITDCSYRLKDYLPKTAKLIFHSENMSHFPTFSQTHLHTLS